MSHVLSPRSLELAQTLVRMNTVSANSNLELIDFARDHLAGLGIRSRLTYNADKTKANLFATLGAGKKAGVIVSGHTDTVPWDGQDWSVDPLSAIVQDWPKDDADAESARVEPRLYGRGSADMKSFIAIALANAERFIESDSPLAVHFAFSYDEEVGCFGVRELIADMKDQGIKPLACIVGEPTSVERCGDMIKNGRRGTMSGKLTVKGVQGHIAYPHLAKNPVHAFAPALAELVAINAAGGWDAGNAHFQPTSWQISNFHAGTGASNVIPGSAVIDFNFRFSTESTPESLQRRVHGVLDAHGVDCELTWTVGGLPFLTQPGELVEAVQQSIRDETGIDTELSTSGGTSDARFIAKICKQVIELGPVNASIHKIDEHIAVADIEPLKDIYRRTLDRLEALLSL